MKEVIPGVEISVFCEKNILEPESDGFVGFLASGQQAAINAEVYMLEEYNVYGFSVDNKKNVVLKKNWAPCYGPPLEGRKYQAKISIKLSLEGLAHTEYPNNHLRLLRLDSNGDCYIWEVALISQNGYFFLTTQTTYEFCCYRQGKMLVAPFFDSKWPQLVTFLRQLPIDINELPDFSEYAPKPAQKKKNLEPQTGRVLWYNHAQGIGAIETPEGNARIHWSQIKPRPRLAYLETNELVSFQQLIEPVQTKARSTTFPKDAIGVKVL